MLTKKQRYRLAKEARVLAMECVEGTEPRMYTGSWCECAIAVSLKRAGIAFRYPRLERLAMELDAVLMDHSGDFGLGLVSLGLARQLGEDYDEAPPTPGAAVFPLMAWADALEGSP